MTHRYAIYFSPPTASALGDLGASWLGRTIEGQDLAPPTLADIASEDWESAIAAPRRYGFHATLKPPFRLAEGFSEGDLLAEVRTYCATTAPVFLGQLGVAQVSDFMALRPERHEAVARLAADIVRTFDVYRAPLTPDETERRRPGSLSPAQRTLLDSWGYPYVMGEFRFHMTLTGRLSPEDRERYRTELEKRFVPAKIGAVTVDDLCVFRQESPDSDLTLLHRFALPQV